MVSEEDQLKSARVHLAQFEKDYEWRPLASAAKLLSELVESESENIRGVAKNLVSRYSTRVLNIGLRLRAKSSDRSVLEYWHKVMAELADPSLGVSDEYCSVTEDLWVCALSLKPSREWTSEEREQYRKLLHQFWAEIGA